MAEKMTTEAEELEKDGPQQIQILRGGDNSNYMFVGRVAKKSEDVIALKGKGDFKDVVEGTLPEQVVARNYTPTVGTATTLDEVWSCLRGFAASPNFDIVIWAVVSKDVKLEKVQEQIWKTIGFFGKKWERKSLCEKVDDILRILSTKKFLLLLDDIWQRVNLEKIGVPLTTRQNGSR
ncbi:probable disease resistance protein At5g63020 [Hevea brasiliensis]|uniref:probable disease resistance protein At5g63020 n=1 Tax=Hevea brasiliensis TaxID=3981 RepID=UPI0025D7F490|nr:probable disease resistance protein At5g63020 [Hevea brasiliensis]